MTSKSTRSENTCVQQFLVAKENETYIAHSGVSRTRTCCVRHRCCLQRLFKIQLTLSPLRPNSFRCISLPPIDSRCFLVSLLSPRNYRRGASPRILTAVTFYFRPFRKEFTPMQWCCRHATATFWICRPRQNRNRREPGKHLPQKRSAMHSVKPKPRPPEKALRNLIWFAEVCED